MNGLFFANIATLSTLEFKVHLSFLTLNISFFMFQTYKGNISLKEKQEIKLKEGSFPVAKEMNTFPRRVHQG